MANLTEARRDEILQRVAGWLHRSGLQTPVAWFLALHEPLSFLGGQALLFSQPLLEPLLGDGLRDCALLLEDRENVKRLLALLEAEPAGPRE